MATLTERTFAIGDEYVPDAGFHRGERVRVIGTHRGYWVRVRCECGEEWSFRDPVVDELAKDGDGWPE